MLPEGSSGGGGGGNGKILLSRNSSSRPSGGVGDDRVNPPKHFPCCVVWCPLPLITAIFPPIGKGAPNRNSNECMLRSPPPLSPPRRLMPFVHAHASCVDPLVTSSTSPPREPPRRRSSTIPHPVRLACVYEMHQPHVNKRTSDEFCDCV